MDPQIIQNIRYKLQKRIRRLNSVGISMFIPALRQFWVFFDSNPIFSGIIEPLISRFPELDGDAGKIFNGGGLVAGTEEEAAALGYAIIRRVSSGDNHSVLFSLARLYAPASTGNEALETFRDVFLEPFYEFLDESLDDQRAMLALLFRYKYRCEWFHRDRLWNMIQKDSRHAERLLSLDLYEYLHDQGINFTIEPSSLTGEIDLIAAQGSNDPLLADTKIFDAASRGKTYIRKGFNQIYTYTQQYNEPFGYLIIFKTAETELRFSLSTSGNIPMVIHNHKALFLITIDIFPNPKPVSQRNPLEAVKITEEELVQTIAGR
jgi:hypothetical protein